MFPWRRVLRCPFAQRAIAIITKPLCQLGFREMAEDRMKTQLQEYRANQTRRLKRVRPPYTARVNASRRQGVEHFYGSHGPASPVRRIDPLTGEVTEIIDAKVRYDRPEENN